MSSNYPSVKINLNSIDKVKAFTTKVSKFDEEFDIYRGRYIIDAKSIMGIFSADLTRDMDLVVHTDSKERFSEITRELKEFIVDTVE